jgi:hypothetical protein
VGLQLIDVPALRADHAAIQLLDQSHPRLSRSESGATGRELIARGAPGVSATQGLSFLGPNRLLARQASMRHRSSLATLLQGYICLAGDLASLHKQSGPFVLCTFILYFLLEVLIPSALFAVRLSLPLSGPFSREVFIGSDLSFAFSNRPHTTSSNPVIRTQPF